MINESGRGQAERREGAPAGYQEDKLSGGAVKDRRCIGGHEVRDFILGHRLIRLEETDQFRLDVVGREFFVGGAAGNVECYLPLAVIVRVLRGLKLRG